MTALPNSFTRPLRLRVASVGVAAVTLVAPSLRADIYKYVDSEGVVHFSNTKKNGKVIAKERPRPPASRGKSAGVDPSRFDRYIRDAAALYQIPVELVRAVIAVESGFNPRAVSHANARGLMQLIPETAERMMVTDVFDPRQNIFGGVRYLRVLANLFNGDIELTLAAYNAGENAVIRHGGIPPFAETREYVGKVLARYDAYRRPGR